MASGAPMAGEGASEAAVRHLQRIDPSITSIIAKARHVVVYVFKQDANGRSTWEKERVEGAMYLVRRALEPKYALAVINRAGTGDVIHALEFGSIDFEFEFKSNFFIFRFRETIRSLWLQLDESEKIREVILRCEHEVRSTPPAAKSVSRTPGDMLSIDELRDGLLRLINNDQFMQSLYSEYVTSEQRKRAGPMQHPTGGYVPAPYPVASPAANRPAFMNPGTPGYGSMYPQYPGVPFVPMGSMGQPQQFVPQTSPYKPN